MAGTHLQRDDYFGDSDALARYKEWIAEEHGLANGHEVFHTPGALTRPEDFELYEDLFK